MKTHEVCIRLRELGRGEQLPRYADFGVCSFLREDCGRSDLRKLLQATVKQWPFYSDNSIYPVPGPPDAYDKQTLWELGETTDPYILARRDLCLWFADYLEAHNEE